MYLPTLFPCRSHEILILFFFFASKIIHSLSSQRETDWRRRRIYKFCTIHSPLSLNKWAKENIWKINGWSWVLSPPAFPFVILERMLVLAWNSHQESKKRMEQEVKHTFGVDGVSGKRVKIYLNVCPDSDLWSSIPIKPPSWLWWITFHWVLHWNLNEGEWGAGSHISIDYHLTHCLIKETLGTRRWSESAKKDCCPCNYCRTGYWFAGPDPSLINNSVNAHE